MKLRPFVRGERRASRGQGLVEFALVFPLIALLLFGIIDLGRAVYGFNTIANAAREGVRVAVVNQSENTTDPASTVCRKDMPVEVPAAPHWSIKACAAQSAIALGVKTSDVSVSYSAPSSDPHMSCTASALSVGCIATVTVKYIWVPVTPLLGNLGGINMTSTSQMPVERVFP